MATYGPSETKNEYGGTPAVIKASLPAAVVAAPEPVVDEETTKVTVTPDVAAQTPDSISGLIDDINIEALDATTPATGGSSSASQ